LTKIILNNTENFDGIINKVSIDNYKKSISIEIKQWNNTKNHCLSILEFKDVIFQSLPDISSFNLVTEIIKKEKTKPVLNELNDYLNNNPSVILSNTKENITKDITSLDYIQSFLFESGYCKDWLIICNNMILTEVRNEDN